MNAIKSAFMTALFFSVCSSQVFNTGQTISPKHVSFTAAPLFFIDDVPRPGIYGMFGIGLPGHLDLSLNARGAENRSYLGADIEWGILRGFPSLSITIGMHGFRHAGIDGTVNLTFPIREVAAIYGGVDCDVDFINHNVQVPVWGFGGVEVKLWRMIHLIFELDIGVTPPAAPIMGGCGFIFYL